MNAEIWIQVKDLLGTLLEIEPARRHEFLTQAKVSSEISGEVESLLAFEDAAEGLMTVPAIALAKSFPDDNPEQTIIGQRVGVYKIVSDLGYGGMGAVYLAERIDGKFSQRVALKLLKRELNTASLRQRFEQERQILATLVHPNIARLLDAGTTDDGVPYFAMEYVEGLPLDKFCSDGRLGLIERLKLFNKVCDAVAFAHQNLIVHRDLKPSNVIVTADGSPKLLDFGISKLLIFSGMQTQAFTKLGPLTPEYASPEQIQGGTVSTATDIYSLGVILFKLLTGGYPYDLRNKVNGDVQREITDTEPTLPSRAASLSHKAPIAGGQLVGDLDNVILKALRKEPEQRYRTVEQFSGDIWRFIDGLPVFARPATLSYRFSKFYRRNKIAVGAAALILISVFAGSAIAFWQARVARANAAIAVTESDNAKAEQTKAEKVSKFMLRFMSYASPHWDAEGHRFGGEARVIDALNDMESKIDAEFADQPDVLAEFHHQFADIYGRRPREEGYAEKRLWHARRALEIRKSYYGSWHELVAKDMVYVYWSRPPGTSDADVQLLADAIVMMRATNPKNLNLPFMLETYFHRMSDDKDADFHEMFLRHVPQPAPNDKYLASDQLFDEMLGLLRIHYSEDSSQVVQQKCAGMELKRKVNKRDEAEAFYQACKDANEYLRSIGKPSPNWPKLLEDYVQNRDNNH